MLVLGRLGDGMTNDEMKDYMSPRWPRTDSAWQRIRRPPRYRSSMQAPEIGFADHWFAAAGFLCPMSPEPGGDKLALADR